MKDVKRFSIGVSPEKYAWLISQAQNKHRSMSGQINRIIEEAMKGQQEETQQKQAA